MARSFKMPKGVRGEKRYGPPENVPPNLLILARFDQRSAKIISVQAAARPPAKSKLSPVLLTDETADDYSIGTTEIVVAFHRRDGAHLASWGHSGRGKVFVDDLDEDVKGNVHIDGGLKEPPRDVRLLHLHVPHDAAYLAFYRTEVVDAESLYNRDPGESDARDPRAAGKHAIMAWLLGMYWLAWGEDPKPPTGHPWLPDFKVDRKEVAFIASVLEELKTPDWKPCSFYAKGGKITHSESIPDNADLDDHFNIALLGDGFDQSAADQSLYQEYVDQVIEALKTTEPFKTYYDNDKINIFVVYTESNDSGVTDCPYDTASEKSTYYRVRGCFDGVDYPGYIGSDIPCLIYEAVTDWVAPADQIDVIVVLANCKHYGGSAFIHQKIVYVPFCHNKAEFRNVTLHEMAHEVGHLGEEYIPGAPCPFLETDKFPNIVQRSERHQAPWREIARADELNPATETFAVIRDCDVNSCDHEHNCLSTDLPNPFPKLGLYWGAQYRDAEVQDFRFPTTNICGASTAQGKDFFRAMATCKMRHPEWNFCRWCNHVLSKSIEEAMET
jgi:hypothetical protein